MRTQALSHRRGKQQDHFPTLFRRVPTLGRGVVRGIRCHGWRGCILTFPGPHFRQAAHVVTRLAAGFAGSEQGVAVHHDDAGKVCPFVANGGVHPAQVVTDHDLAGFAAVVAAVFGLGEAPAPGIEAGGVELAQGEGELVADLVVQAALVAFDAEDVVAAFLDDLAGDGASAN
jgi:hypothetical protein